MYSALRVSLKQGISLAWKQLCEEIDPQDLYVFAIDPGTDLGTSVSVCANINSALEGDTELERLELRWSSPDWEFSFWGDEELKLFNDEFQSNYPNPYELNESQETAHINAFFGLCVSVLQELDSEGLFGQDTQREHLLLGIIWSDQSDENIIYYAKQLNAPPSVVKLQQELTRLRKLQWSAMA